MNQYVYAFEKVILGDDVYIKFKKFPEITRCLPSEEYSAMSADEVQKYIEDTLILALQNRINQRIEIPYGDVSRRAKADGFVFLSTQQAMKLELFRVYKVNCRSISAFARSMGKQETSVRRMMDLKHASAVTEIEDVLKLFGKRLVHSWDIRPLGLTDQLARPRPFSKKPGLISSLHRK